MLTGEACWSFTTRAVRTLGLICRGAAYWCESEWPCGPSARSCEVVLIDLPVNPDGAVDDLGHAEI